MCLMITIKEEFSFSEAGKRANNEDYLGIQSGCLYIICDGVGGLEKGEIASQLVVNSFLSFSNFQKNFVLEEALAFSEEELSRYIISNPSSVGMATTLVVAQMLDNGVLAGWVGDSRIYQFRSGVVVFQSEDHSWVNEAYRHGIITSEERVNHPKSNVVTRAVQSRESRTVLDTQLISDVKKDDMFFLCSDGVLESWDEVSLKNIFSNKEENAARMEQIRRRCLQYSRDNFSAILLVIGNE